MELLSRRFVEFMLENKIIPEQDKEIYRFGFVLMLRIILNVLTLLFIGTCFNMIVESITFLICSLMLRSYSGGFHSDNPVICFLISVLATISMLFVIKSGMWSVQFSCALIVLSIGVILRYAPVEHKNKPLEEIERKIYRKRLWGIVCVLIFVMFMFIFMNKLFLLYSGSISFGMTAIMILVARGELFNKKS
ncbi:hypothetical protein HMPREF0491_01652 [Lachnospiraceae oral taxon 107 str. F0167]|jgi:membrane protein putatively involved in post-translational modification of the autoinducing quorum-sensing peptide|nr:hypothetical protein HMPREF0491_01652 [Lachnospiraceae oral taxon 107 str. F0167]